MAGVLKKACVWIHVHFIGVWKCLQESLWDRQGSLRGKVSTCGLIFLLYPVSQNTENSQIKVEGHYLKKKQKEVEQ